MAAWERKRILIWGKTRPELSRAHKEVVCTGGVFADTRQFVRLYPIPLRFLDDERVFRKYQWIEAPVRKAIRDARPESYNIRCEDIVVGDTIPTNKGDWSQRAEWITEPAGHVFRSVEALQAARESAHTSIGMVKPLEVTDYRVEAYPEEERRQFWAKYKDIASQQELFDTDTDRPVRPLPPPEFRFRLKFRCDDPACLKDHVFSIFDWEVDALYNRLRHDGGESPQAACDKILAKLRDDVCAEDKDTHLFLGNIAAHPHKFTIVGLWYPKKKPKGLFDQLTVG